MTPNHLTGLLILVASLLHVSSTAKADDGETATSPHIARILEVCDIVADRHAEPPVMQQVVLFAAKSMYSTKGEDPPLALSRKVSELTKPEQFASLLESISSEVGDIDADEVIRDFASRIQGGGTLIDAEQARVEATVAANQYVGVGIALSIEDGLPFISTSFYGGPGHKAGVKTEDSILEIDGESTKGKDLAQIVKELRGAKGTDVKLLLNHPTAGERELVVTRDTTFIPTIHGATQDEDGKWNYRMKDHSDIAYFAIDRFGASTAHELRKLQDEFGDEPPKGIVLDLRRGGGSLHDVVMVANQLLNAGVMGSTKIGEKEAEYRTEDGCLFEGIPIVALTAETSSASSVFLTAALQDRGRVTVVGMPTRGMSYVRSQFDLSNGDKLIIPSGYARRVNGTVLFSNDSSAMIMRDLDEDTLKTIDRKSANVVVPDHLVTDGGEPQLITKALSVVLAGRKSGV